MDVATAESGAFEETVVFLSYFKDLADPRQQGKVSYPLDEILLLCLLAVLAGAETFVDIALFGSKKLGLLRRFRPFSGGTPAHDHLGDILAVLDAGQFQRCFVAWVAARLGTPQGVIAIDGKTARRTYDKKNGRAAIHMVSAFAARQRLVLGQVAVADKSNEITAIPKLLDMLAIEGAIVTIDAMGCQRAIARKILDKKADYMLALKGNQGALRDDVALFVAEQKAKGFSDTTISQDHTVDGDHGRIETRTTTVIHDVDWLTARHDWPGLNGVVIVESTREIFTAKIRQLLPSREDWKRAFPAMLRGTGIEFLLGVIPGGSAVIASFASYAMEKRLSNHPEQFGSGAIEGVAGPETANNAAASGAFIPLFVLGIPSNATTAILLGALMLHGVRPGPMLMEQQAGLFWGIIASMYVGNVILLVLNLPLIGLWVKILKVPYKTLFPLILLFCVIGAYSVEGSVLDIGVMLGFGVLGYVLRKMGFQGAPLVLAFILGPMLENSMRQSLIISHGSFLIFVQRPIAAACLLTTVMLLLTALVPFIRNRRELLAEES